MKKFAFLFAAFCLVLAGCKPEDDPTPGPDTKDSITAASGTNLSPVLGTDGGSVTVSFNASGSWTASVISTRADGWVSITPASGSGNGTITIKAEANTGFDDRYADIQVKCGTASLNVSLTQKQKDAVTLTSTKYEIGAEGGAVTIEVKANVDFNYEIEAAAREWISKVDSKSYTSHNLTFDIAPNEGTSKRNGAITFTSGSYKESVIIYQEGSVPTIILSDNELTVGSAGEVIKIDVTHNVDVEFAITGDWIKEDATKAMSTNAFYFTVEENTGVDERSGVIKFFNKDSDISETVIVNQLQCDVINLDAESVEVSADEGQFEVNVGSNVVYSIDIDADWIRVLNTKAYESKTVIFAYDENTAKEERTATVKFTDGNGLEKTIAVKQAAATDIALEFTSIEVPAEGQEFRIGVTSSLDYKISISEDWVTEIPTKGATTSIVTFKVAPNATFESRTAEVKFYNEEKEAESVLLITQAQTDAVTIDKDVMDVVQEGGIADIVLGHNVDVTVRTDVSWIKELTTKSFVTETRSFEIAANDSFEKRTGHIFFESGNDALLRTITVNQDCKTFITVDPESVHFDSDGGSFTATVSANLDYTADWGGEPWIVKESEDAETGTFKFKVYPSISESPRSADIVFANAEYGVSAKIAVSQDQKDIIILDNEYFHLEPAGGAFDININHTNVPEITVTMNPEDSWIQLTGQTDTKFSFNVDAGPTLVNRSTTMTVSGGKAAVEVTVIQKSSESFVNFKDAKFKAYCVANYDSNGDGEISLNEAKAANHMAPRDVESFAGIEEFVNITVLEISSDTYDEGPLKELDLSHNLKLEDLKIAHQATTSLTLNGLSSLKTAVFSINYYLKDLTVTNCPVLETLDLYDNRVTNLNLSNNPQLSYLDLSGNKDLAGITDILNNTPSLEKLYLANNNNITELDLNASLIPNLTDLRINLSSLLSFECQNTTSLNSLMIDASNMQELFVHDNSNLEYLYSYEASKLEYCDICWNYSLWDITMDLPAAEEVHIYSNYSLTDLSSVDMPMAKIVDFEDNCLETVDCSNFPSAESLYLNDNYIKSLYNFGALSNLKKLELCNNRLTSFNVSLISPVESLDISENYTLTSMNVLGMNKLKVLDCRNCNLGSISFYKNNIKYLDCSQNKITSLDVSACSQLSDGLYVLQKNKTSSTNYLSSLTVTATQLSKLSSNSIPNDIAAAITKGTTVTTK